MFYSIKVTVKIKGKPWDNSTESLNQVSLMHFHLRDREKFNKFKNPFY